MKITAIYDSGDDSLDRYTVVTDIVEQKVGGSILYMMLGISEGGKGVSQWSAGYDGEHLGKRIRFEELSEETQGHIALRVFGDD